MTTLICPGDHVSDQGLLWWWGHFLASRPWRLNVPPALLQPRNRHSKNLKTNFVDAEENPNPNPSSLSSTTARAFSSISSSTVELKKRAARNLISEGNNDGTWERSSCHAATATGRGNGGSCPACHASPAAISATSPRGAGRAATASAASGSGCSDRPNSHWCSGVRDASSSHPSTERPK